MNSLGYRGIGQYSGGRECFWLPDRRMWVDRECAREVAAWVAVGWSVDEALKQVGARRGFTAQSV